MQKIFVSLLPCAMGFSAAAPAALDAEAREPQGIAVSDAYVVANWWGQDRDDDDEKGSGWRGYDDADRDRDRDDYDDHNDGETYDDD